MTKEQTEYFERLIALGRYRAAVTYAANIMLGPDLASQIIRPAR